MPYKIEKSLQLSKHEFSLIESDINDGLLFQCHAKYAKSMNINAFRGRLECGELVILADPPSRPLLIKSSLDSNQYVLNSQVKNFFNYGVSTRLLNSSNTQHTPIQQNNFMDISIDHSSQFMDEQLILEEKTPQQHFEYNVEFSCPDSVFANESNYLNMNIYLKPHNNGKTIQVHYVNEFENISRYQAFSDTNTTCELVLHHAEVKSGLSNNSIKWNLAGTKRVDDSYIILMPTIEFDDKLGFPSSGYWYHFEKGVLIQEFKITGEYQWLFSKTKSSKEILSDTEFGFCQRVIMVFGLRHGQVVADQYVVYLEERISKAKLKLLSNFNAAALDWLNDNGVYIDVEDIWGEISTRDVDNAFYQEDNANSSLNANSMNDDAYHTPTVPGIINAPSDHIDRSNQEFIPNSQSIYNISNPSYVSNYIPLLNVRHYHSASKGIAYIVNIILSHSEISRIPAVVGKIRAGLNKKYLDAKVYIVLGINAKKIDHEKLGPAKIDAENLIKKLKNNVQITTMLFGTKEFPYGKMRNSLLYSKETISLIKKCISKGYEPYISIQDFDDGSRNTAQGIHIFKHIDKLLENDTDGHCIRPLMIAGGYRAVHGYIDDDGEYCQHTYKSGFVDAINDDMLLRNEYAKLDPMLPYAPEPNLFFDAKLLLSNTNRIAFGDNKAEYIGLSASLALQNMAELERYYTHEYNSAVDESNEIDLIKHKYQAEDASQLHYYENVPLDRTKNEVVSTIQACSQTNRHPVRGISFYLDFEMTIETDLRRIEKDYNENGTGIMPQQHNLKTIMGQMFANRENKKDARWASIENSFDYNADIDLIKGYSAAVVEDIYDNEEEDDEDNEEDNGRGWDFGLKEFIDKHKTMLIGSPAATSATAMPFRSALSDMFNAKGVFSNEYYNVSRSHLHAFAYQAIITSKLHKKRQKDK